VIRGINYPWTVFDGRANYGCDFGGNQWASHTGVTANVAAVQADFAALSAAHIEVARWFVFTDGRGGIQWNDRGEINGLERLVFDDMDAAIEIAASHGMRLCLVLLDYLWFDHPLRRVGLLDDHGASAFADRVLDPFLDRFGGSPIIHSFDLINEPDWIVTELATDPGRAIWPLDRLREFAAVMARRIRRRAQAMITIGGGRVSGVSQWNEPIYDLDFIQVHSYPDVRDRFRDATVFGRAAADFGVAKPILIGEFPSNPRVHPPDHLPPAYTMRDYLALARDGGYLGAWPWSFKGTDAFGPVDLGAFAVV